MSGSGGWRRAHARVVDKGRVWVQRTRVVHSGGGGSGGERQEGDNNGAHELWGKRSGVTTRNKRYMPRLLLAGEFCCVIGTVFSIRILLIARDVCASQPQSCSQSRWPAREGRTPQSSPAYHFALLITHSMLTGTGKCPTSRPAALQTSTKTSFA